ncbi:MAG TPA: TIM barrel protein, partial [Opitutus sp.]|nr:TIM barrel protein [Opitutus sp.]
MKHVITRREAIVSLAGAAALAALPRTHAADAKSSTQPMSASAPDLSSGPPIQHSVCKWCYRDIPLETFAAAAREIGLQSIELLDPADWPVVQRHGLTCAMANYPTAKTSDGTTVGGIGKAWNRVEHHDALVSAYEKRIGEVADAGLTNLICFSGNREGLDDPQGLENCAVGLKRILPLAEKRGVTIVMELLNSKVNHKDYMCDRTTWGVELAKRIGSERFKLLYDIYHMQIMEGDVIQTIRDNIQYIGHVHTGGVPGRHEIDETQEL